MKIIQFYQKDTPIGNGIFTTEDVVIVEMTQEEYKFACHAIIEASKKKE